MVTLQVNGVRREIDVDPATPLLWVIREQLQLTGTKYGCGIAQCGACTVHLNGSPDALMHAAGIRRGSGRRSPPLKDLPTAGNCIRCSRPGLLNRCLSAGTVSLGQIMSAVALLAAQSESD